MNTTVAHQLRQIIKPQAPYTVVALMLDGSLICPTCTESLATRIIRSTHEYRRGWPEDDDELVCMEWPHIYITFE